MQASYGFTGETPSFCGRHRGANHTNLVSRKCAHPDCSRIPLFGSEATEIPLRCFIHKRPGEHNIKSKKCEQRGCMKQPSFGVRAFRTPGLSLVVCFFVWKHAYTEGKRERPFQRKWPHLLASPQMKASPLFPVQVKGGKPRFCRGHVQGKSMMNLSKLKGKKCEEQGCHRRPSFSVCFPCARDSTILAVDLALKAYLIVVPSPRNL